MKKKSVLSVAFVISLLPMLLNQYGAAKGVQEITGLINLFNPIGIIAVVLFAFSVLATFKNQFIGKILGALGTLGIVASELYNFFTWHVLTITGEVNLQHSIKLAFPEFYFGLIVSLAMVVAYFVIEQKVGNVPVSAPTDYQI